MDLSTPFTRPFTLHTQSSAKLRQRDALSRPIRPSAPSNEDTSKKSALSVSAAASGVPVFTPPNFTMAELFADIPPHCFQRSTIRSFSYLARDVVIAAVLIYCATFIDSAFGRHGIFISGSAGTAAQTGAWLAYIYFSGLTWTGIWVLGHEAGHQAFANSKPVNYSVGFIIHSALLVPFHSWRLTHAAHHSGIGHAERDQTFIPKTRQQLGLPALDKSASQDEIDGAMPESFYARLDDLLEDAPIWAFLGIVTQQLLGWPLYLLTNASGQPRYPRWTNHFNPNSVLFKPQHRREIMVSNLGIAAMLLLLAALTHIFGKIAILKFYVLPYLCVNHWLVLVTYLQHTDVTLPHYRDGAFTFQRGALCTMDREIHGWWFHGIAEHHIAHHLFARIPHYHAAEATLALKQKLGPYYSHSSENYWLSLWKTYRQCRFVDDSGDVVWYKNAKGSAQMRLAPHWTADRVRGWKR